MKPTVLLVEDDESVAYMLEMALVDDGFRVTLAADGRIGWEAFQAERPNIVLTDIKMPHMDGIELLSRIKAIDPEMDVVLLTAYSDLPTAIKALELGARRYLQKPIRQIGNIGLILKDLIEKRRLEHDRRLIDRISQDLSRQLSLPDLLDLFLEHTISASSQIDMALISLYDPNERGLTILRAHGIPDSLAIIGLQAQASWHMGTRAFNQASIVRLDGRKLNLDEIKKTYEGLPAPIIKLAQEHPTSGVVGIPIISEGQPIGSLEVASFNSLDRLSNHLISLLTTLCDQVGLYLRNAMLFENWQAQTGRLQAVLNSTMDGMVVIDPDGQIIMANPQFQSMLSPGMRLNAQAQQRLIALLQSSLEEQEQTYFFFTLDHPSSDAPTVLEIHAAHVSQGEQSVGIVASLRDITLSYSLDKGRDDVLRFAKHEVGTPLAAIQAYVHNLLNLSGQLSEEQRVANLNQIAQQAQEVGRLVEETLSYSQLKGELVTREQAPLNLSQLANELAMQAAVLAEQGELEFTALVEPNLWVTGNSTLQQAFRNLIDNARRFTPAGGSITWRVYQDGPNIVAEVTDNGVGIPHDELEKIFTLYYRASTAGSASGSGLGLCIASDIIAAHRGRIEVECREGQGCQFKVTLLAAPPQWQDTADEDPPRPQPYRQTKLPTSVTTNPPVASQSTGRN